MTSFFVSDWSVCVLRLMFWQKAYVVSTHLIGHADISVNALYIGRLGMSFGSFGDVSPKSQLVRDEDEFRPRQYKYRQLTRVAHFESGAQTRAKMSRRERANCDAYILGLNEEDEPFRIRAMAKQGISGIPSK